MSQPLSGLLDELERDRETLERELAEIELLLRQASTEAERHEARRVQAEERLAALEGELPAVPEALVEARAQLISQTRRATLMQSQLDVLTGKQRALQRFHDRLVASLTTLQGLGPSGPPASAEAAPAGTNGPTSALVLEAQEHLRREISRQMHDGPAQSIANIALKAQVVQRLFDRQPERAQAELNELVGMVEHALEATKDFIFDVRPMVLDDLGLVPTLRRATAERSRRTSIDVRFDSVGADRRLPTELESALFRIVDDAMAGYLAGHPPELLVRLDWHEHGVRARVSSRSAESEEPAEARARAAVAEARHEKQMPAALASMIREQRHDSALRSAGLPDLTWNEIEQRARAAGIQVTLSPEHDVVEAVAEISH